ncbi:hypothetical protein EC988_004019 [Linderina pennispora]|nr:hypothetical protein EC988_004019 [Linderina pennispora]
MKLSFAAIFLAATTVLAAPSPNDYDKRAVVVNVASLQQAAKNYQTYANQLNNILSQMQNTQNNILSSFQGSARTSLNSAQSDATNKIHGAIGDISKIVSGINGAISSYQGADGHAAGLWN